MGRSLEERTKSSWVFYKKSNLSLNNVFRMEKLFATELYYLYRNTYYSIMGSKHWVDY